jgi:Tol biopolymer transport system component
MRFGLLALLSCVSCGNGFPTLKTGSDAGADSGAACDPTKPFGVPTLIPMSDPGPFDLSPYLSDDELTMYFTGARDDASTITDVFVTSRPTTTSSFGVVTLVSVSAPSPVNDNAPAISPDGLTLYFVSDRGGNNTNDIYVVTRPSPQSAWGAPTSLTSINDPTHNDGEPFPDRDGAMWFGSDRAGSYDIYVAAQTSGSFGAPVRVAELTSGADDTFPTLSADGLTMYFATTRAAGTKIFAAQRDSKTVPFAPPSPVTELNLVAEQVPRWLSKDGCRLYFTQIATTYSNYVATRGQ